MQATVDWGYLNGRQLASPLSQTPQSNFTPTFAAPEGAIQDLKNQYAAAVKRNGNTNTANALKNQIKSLQSAQAAELNNVRNAAKRHANAQINSLRSQFNAEKTSLHALKNQLADAVNKGSRSAQALTQKVDELEEAKEKLQGLQEAFAKAQAEHAAQLVELQTLREKYDTLQQQAALHNNAIPQLQAALDLEPSQPEEPVALKLAGQDMEKAYNLAQSAANALPRAAAAIQEQQNLVGEKEAQVAFSQESVMPDIKVADNTHNSVVQAANAATAASNLAATAQEVSVDPKTQNKLNELANVASTAATNASHAAEAGNLNAVNRHVAKAQAASNAAGNILESHPAVQVADVLNTATSAQAIAAAAGNPNLEKAASNLATSAKLALNSIQQDSNPGAGAMVAASHLQNRVDNVAAAAAQEAMNKPDVLPYVLQNFFASNAASAPHISTLSRTNVQAGRYKDFFNAVNNVVRNGNATNITRITSRTNFDNMRKRLFQSNGTYRSGLNVGSSGESIKNKVATNRLQALQQMLGSQASWTPSVSNVPESFLHN